MKTPARKGRPLTDVEIRGFSAKDKPYKMGDGEGLYIMIYPNGSKLWGMQYRFNGKWKRTSFGAWPRVSIRDARRRKDEIKDLLAQGIDPAAHKREAKIAIMEEERQQGATFAAVAQEWYNKKALTWSERQRKTIRLRLENMVFPYIGNRPIAELKVNDFLSVARKAEERGAIETAHRVSQLCGQVSRYARLTGLIEHDSASGLTEALAPVTKKHYPAIVDPLELGAFLRATDEYAGTVCVKYALRIVPYVFVRSGELRNARWSEFDLVAARWTIPAERMKMRRPHIVPLASQVKALFKELYEYTGTLELVFPSSFTKARSITDVALLNAVRRLGYTKEQVCIHGFRATASTLLNEQGFRADVIEAQLAHAERDSVRRAYNHAIYIEERTAMMQWWADFLDSLKNNDTNGCNND